MKDAQGPSLSLVPPKLYIIVVFLYRYESKHKKFKA